MLKRATFFALLALIFVVGSGPATAQEASSPEETPIRVGIVDLGKVRQNSTAMASVARQISQYREEFQKDIQAEEASLREANQELARQQTIISPEAFEEARQQFEQRVADVQRKVQQRKQALEAAQENALRQMHQTLNLAIAEIAKERGLTLIMRRDQTIMSATSLEITDEVLQRVNQQLPDITVAKPGQ